MWIALAGTLIGNCRTATEDLTGAQDNKDNADRAKNQGACNNGTVFATLAEQRI
jgi:hypothetical protein